MESRITKSNYEDCLLQLSKLEEDILEIRTQLEQDNYYEWCLGDPFEMLSSMELKRDELQHEIQLMQSSK